MPTTILFPPDAKYSGIVVTWTPSAMRIDISGWYDGFIGIQGKSMTLYEFFNRLGIKQNHIKKAMKELSK